MHLMGCYDTLILDNFTNAAKKCNIYNASTSSGIWNAILQVAHTVLLQLRAEDVDDGQFISVIMDELSDITHHERYADKILI